MLKFNDYKGCLLNGKVVFKSQQRFKSERHDVYTGKVNKIALSSNDEKDCKLLIKLQLILMEEVQEEYVKQSILMKVK